MPALRPDPSPTPRPACEPVPRPGPPPTDLIRSWPPDRPLAAWCWQGDDAARPTVRLAAPAESIALAPAPDALEHLDRLLARPKPTTGPAHRAAGWLVLLDYDLTRLTEPRLEASRHPSNAGPVAELHRIEGSLRLDPDDNPDDSPDDNPDETDRQPRWTIAQEGAAPDISDAPSPCAAPAYTLAPLTSELDGAPPTYADAVRRALAYIRTGDIYQVNLTHALRAPFTGSARALFADLFGSTLPRHGVYLESPSDAPGHRRAVASISPELFLEITPDRLARTRPMKGTRPLDADPAELLHAEKDHAELAMIVDLMRNDLGRLAIPGTLRVRTPRALERHDAGVLQATATVEARLRTARPSDLLRAVFPPGSVTGAPKIRAQQIIDELERTPRGPYCGCLGWFGDDGTIRLNVAIRTAVIEGTPGAHAQGHFDNATLTYRVGAGIVADSDPGAEHAETLLKAGAIARLVNAP
ncbi:MAG: anthranilate synthase component I family protein [Planctomycetota bacterium]